jgi:hypothetical protein
MAAAKSKKYSSDRRERMKELQREGKLTPEHGRLGGRPRKKPDTQKRRASTVVAEKAGENADQIAKVLTDCILDPDAAQADKMRAVKLAIGIEGTETERERDERNDPSRAEVNAATVEEAREALVRKLRDPVTGPRLRAALAASLAEAGDSSHDA